TLPEASLLVNVSNDAWWGDSFGPHQHLQIASMRALEGGRPLLRSTNTGITAIVDHRGRITATAPQFQVAVLTGQVQPRQGATPYVRWGNLPVVLLMTGMLVLFQGNKSGFSAPVVFRYGVAVRRQWLFPCQALQRRSETPQGRPKGWPVSVHGGVAPLAKGDGHSLRGAPCPER
ncbi:MAG TPA: hypothetical protein ENJ43_06140, partial [Gammaproteobacteria bacterium]|nr:hypothetical protein [Gammaproteobacteria bacterium]